MKTQAQRSFDSRDGHSARGDSSNIVVGPDGERSDYGDDVFDGFESEDRSPSSRSSNYGGGFEKEKPSESTGKQAVSSTSAPTSDDAGLQAGSDKDREGHEEAGHGIDETSIALGGTDDEKRKKIDAGSLSTRARPYPEQEEGAGGTDVQEPYSPLQALPGGDADSEDGAYEFCSLDEHSRTAFLLDGDRSSPQGDFLGPGGREQRRPSKKHELSSEPFVASEAGVCAGDGPWPQQERLPQQIYNPESRKGGTKKQQVNKGARSWSFKRRAQAQDSNGQLRPPEGNQSHVDAGAASNIRRERQERLIQQLTRDNGVLQRKVAGYQLALQLSADEDDFSTSPSFSAAMKLQQTAPPTFPRDGGTPAPSPRVARGWTYQNQPPMGRSSTIERNLSYTTLVRQLDRGRRRAKSVERANEVLGARVNELESGAVLRATQSKLIERDEEIVALRDELSVLTRLARAQDRKFEGSQEHALARRLWLTEEELRTARSTISSLGAEVYGLRQFRRIQEPNRRRHSAIRGAGSTPEKPSNTGPRQPSPRRPLRRRRTSHQNCAVADPGKEGQERGQVGSGSPTANGFDGSLHTRGSLSGGGKAVASSEGTVEGITSDHQAASKQMSETKTNTLQRALANMRSKAKGERRAAQAEINGLKEDKAILGQALGVKAKEIRMQLLQVNYLKREIRDLSAGAIRLEEASCVVASASLAYRKRGVESAAATGGETLTSAVTKLGERRAKSAAIVSRFTGPAAKGAGQGSLVSSAGRPRVLRAHPYNPRCEGNSEGGGGDRTGHFAPMGWDRDWDERGTTAASIADTDTPRIAVRKQPDADATTIARGDRGAVLERASAEVQAETPGAGGGDGDESRGAKLDEAEGEENEVAAESKEIQADGVAAASAVPRKALRPCPLSGILDMSEPPLHSHRRSYYSEGDDMVYLVPRTSGEQTPVAKLTEAPREDERLKCVIDFQGAVRHGEDCSLRGVAHSTAMPQNKWHASSARKRSSLHNHDSVALNRGSDLDTPPISVGIPIRTWHRDSSSDWDPTGDGRAERLSIVSRHSRARNSCVSLSEEGRLSATLSVARRPTHFSVEPVPELDA